MLSNSEFITPSGIKTHRGNRKLSQVLEHINEHRIGPEIRKLDTDQSFETLDKTVSYITKI